MSEVARLLCKAIELREAAARCGGEAFLSVAGVGAEYLEQAMALEGKKRIGRDGRNEWDVVVLCNGVITLSGEHRPMNDDERATLNMSMIQAEGGE